MDIILTDRLFWSLFPQVELSHFSGITTIKVNIRIVGTMCAQLLLQFYANYFETSLVFWQWSEDVHVAWI